MKFGLHSYSIDDLRSTINGGHADDLTPAEVSAEIEQEKAGQNRSSAIRLMEQLARRINKKQSKRKLP